MHTVLRIARSRIPDSVDVEVSGVSTISVASFSRRVQQDTRVRLGRSVEIELVPPRESADVERIRGCQE